MESLINLLERIRDQMIESKFTRAKSLWVDRIDLVIDWLKGTKKSRGRRGR